MGTRDVHIFIHRGRDSSETKHDPKNGQFTGGGGGGGGGSGGGKSNKAERSFVAQGSRKNDPYKGMTPEKRAGAKKYNEAVHHFSKSPADRPVHEDHKHLANLEKHKPGAEGSGYNPKSVQKAIENNRTGKIGGKEAKMIHALLKGRH